MSIDKIFVVNRQWM